MARLAFPEDMTTDHRAVIEAIVGGAADACVEIDALPGGSAVVAEMIGAGWLTPWRVGTVTTATLTPGAAGYLGLVLHGEDNPQWLTEAEAARAMAPKVKARKRESNVTDLTAFSGAGDDGVYFLDLFPAKRQDGGLAEPVIVLLGCSNPWLGGAGLVAEKPKGKAKGKPSRKVVRASKAPAPDPTCPVCAGRPLRRGEYCGACDRHSQDKPPKEAEPARQSA
jgi:hypothetical protein